jgi:hypothetical protein
MRFQGHGEGLLDLLRQIRRLLFVGIELSYRDVPAKLTTVL